MVRATVTVVIPNWNRRELLMRLLDLLARQTHPVTRVVVVDNGSTDGSAEAAGAWGAHVISMGHNAGFSRAVNRGVQAVATEWVAVVNNDVEPEPEWLERLLGEAQGADAWFVCGKLLSAARRDRIDGTFDLVCRGGCAWRAGHGREDGPEWERPRTIRFAPFTASLFRAALFEKVGLLDESFESYLEDVDFGLRCAGAGCEGVYAPRAVAYHAGSATLGAWDADTVRRIARNQLFLVAKHFPKGWLWRYGWPVLVAQALWGLVALRHGKAAAYLRGKIEGLAGFHGVRRSAPLPGDGVVRAIEDSERQLRRLQDATGYDLYWKVYFALT